MPEQVEFAFSIYKAGYGVLYDHMVFCSYNFYMKDAKVTSSSNLTQGEFRITLSIHSALYKQAFSRTVKIEFLGVWDTVSSVGGVIPHVLPFSADNHITKTFRHALALDEHRATFRSNTWQLTVDPEDGHHLPPTDVKEVWFPGCHCGECRVYR
jgi:uncharacterized protein (DUF2235 family)